MVMCDTTERPEGVEARTLLDDEAEDEKTAHACVIVRFPWCG